ncbi:hypothetical protein ARMGADRAFT_1028162 [Armillaria gallica]|uniref:Uncharacterized protein n=1 Tax=Armillaria gallica TaxID=47427 RepID=A0A2H3DYG7_ARMGA|nr:hypothetical protein ARMGADRAFT_1028162 [Armillaria gallica]
MDENQGHGDVIADLGRCREAEGDSNVQEFGSKIILMEDVTWTARVSKRPSHVSGHLLEDILNPLFKGNFTVFFESNLLQVLNARKCITTLSMILNSSAIAFKNFKHRPLYLDLPLPEMANIFRSWSILAAPQMHQDHTYSAYSGALQTMAAEECLDSYRSRSRHPCFPLVILSRQYDVESLLKRAATKQGNETGAKTHRCGWRCVDQDTVQTAEKSLSGSEHTPGFAHRSDNGKRKSSRRQLDFEF